jgi:hypothetical protein
VNCTDRIFLATGERGSGTSEVNWPDKIIRENKPQKIDRNYWHEVSILNSEVRESLGEKVTSDQRADDGMVNHEGGAVSHAPSLARARFSLSGSLLGYYWT